MLTDLIENRLEVVRLNFSRGTHEYHRQTELNALSSAKATSQNIAIPLETIWTEIRMGNFVEMRRDYILEKGSKVRLSLDPEMKEKGTPECFYVDYANMSAVCLSGDLVSSTAG